MRILIFFLVLFVFPFKAAIANVPKIQAVYLAQTHVSEPDYPYFNLTANRPALLKVNVVAASNISSPEVVATVVLRDGTAQSFKLPGPETLPTEKQLSSELGLANHNYKDSFFGLLPAELIQPGMYLIVQVGNAKYEKHIKVGAPNVMRMQMFDVSFFGKSSAQDFPKGVFEEIRDKLPVSSLEIRRFNNIRFDELVIPARPDVRTTHVRVSSEKEYKQITGEEFGGAEVAAQQWAEALLAAGGNNDHTMTYVNVVGVESGSESGDFSAAGQVGDYANMYRELGAALGLSNWQNVNEYPYRGHMYGIESPTIDDINGEERAHVGPIWGYDINSKKFIPPTVQRGYVNTHQISPQDVIGKYKREPMAEGGAGEQDGGFFLRHFSDYSVHKIQKNIEDKLINVGSDGYYYRWDEVTGTYAKPIDNRKVGTRHPVQLDIGVISVMASIIHSNQSVNMVYPPIGPYKGNVILTFDPYKFEERQLANSLDFCPRRGCDYVLGIVQGGAKEKLYMLPVGGEPSADLYSVDTLKTVAINLKASDGPVVKASLYYIPDTNLKGVKNKPKPVYVWEKK